MTTYTPPIKDIDFLLHDVMKISTLDVPGYDELDRDFTNAVLDEAGKIARDVLQPLNVVGDTEGLPGAADSLTVGNGDLAAIQGSVSFEGLSGSDLLILNDHLSTSPRDFEGSPRARSSWPSRS